MSDRTRPGVRMATLIGADKKGLGSVEEEEMIEHSTDDPFGKFAAGVFLALQQVEAVMSQHRGKWEVTALIWDGETLVAEPCDRLNSTELAGQLKGRTLICAARENRYMTPSMPQSREAEPLSAVEEHWRKILSGDGSGYAARLIAFERIQVIPEMLSALGVSTVEMLDWVESAGSPFSAGRGPAQEATFKLIEHCLCDIAAPLTKPDATDKELLAFNDWIWNSMLEPTLPTQLIAWIVARGRNLSPEMRALRNNMKRLT